VSDRPAILGGTPVRSGKRWPSWPQWDEAERGRLGETLESGAWSSSAGEQSAAWAREFASFQGARHALPVTNGTHTLEAALAACGVGEGDEVIVPAITFVASASAALAVNATPVIVDVNPDTVCIDIAAAEAAIGERTRAIVAVHVGGVACDLDALEALCASRGIALIEDCAHAPGSRWRGRGLGTFGAFGSFSFESTKLITAGEGGALTCEDEELRRRAWSYANCGRVEGGHWYHHASYGSNFRITEWQAAVLRAQLGRYPEQLRLREERGAVLDRALGAVPGLRPQAADERMDRRARYSYIVHYDPEEFAGLPLSGIEEALHAEGIEFGSSYPPLQRLQLFAAANFEPRMRSVAPRISYAELSLPNADRIATSSIWLPHQLLLADEQDVLEIAFALERIRAHAGRIARRTAAGPVGRRLAGAGDRLAGALRGRRS
jgi:dTDP-4-amino-4,6-dideoxygalactose transaminase